MTIQSYPQPTKKQRRSTLRVFYVFVFVAIAFFSVAVRPNQAAQKELIALGIVASIGAIWSFVRFLRASDAHQKLINHEATSFAFVVSLLLTLVVGLLQRFGILSGVSLLIPASMIAFWSIGLILSFLAVPMKTRLRVLRAEKEWSQAELAETVGVTRQCINAIETGKYEPGLDLAFKYAPRVWKTLKKSSSTRKKSNVRPLLEGV